MPRSGCRGRVRAYPMPCRVAGTATMATSSTKNAPNGLSTRSTPVSGSSSADRSTIGWPVTSTWIAAAASSAHAAQTSTAAIVTRTRLGQDGAGHAGPETEHGAGDDERAGGHRRVTERSASMMAVGSGGQPGIETSTGTTSPTAPTTPYPPRNDPAITSAVTHGDDDPRLRCGLDRLQERNDHVLGDGPGHKDAVRVAGRGDEPSPEALCVVDGAERGHNLELAAVARPGVDMAELNRSLQFP